MKKNSSVKTNNLTRVVKSNAKAIGITPGEYREFAIAKTILAGMDAAAFSDHLQGLAWVRGVSTTNGHAAGVAYVDGKLCEVGLHHDKPPTIEPIKQGDAARLMLSLLDAEIALGLDVHVTDEGLRRWLQEIQSEL